VVLAVIMVNCNRILPNPALPPTVASGLCPLAIPSALRASAAAEGKRLGVREGRDIGDRAAL